MDMPRYNKMGVDFIRTLMVFLTAERKKAAGGIRSLLIRVRMRTQTLIRCVPSTFRTRQPVDSHASLVLGQP